MSSNTTSITSICLPQVLPETSKETIRLVFEQDLKLGHIMAIDMVPRTNGGETCLLGDHEKFLVFVHLKWNILNPDAERMSSILGEGGQVRIFYMQDRFWWVRKSTSDASQDKTGEGGDRPSVEIPPEESLPEPLSSPPVSKADFQPIEFPVYDTPAPYTSNFIPFNVTPEKALNVITDALSNIPGLTYVAGECHGKWECTFRDYLTTCFYVCLWKYKGVLMVESNYISGYRAPFVRLHIEIMKQTGFPEKLTLEDAAQFPWEPSKDNTNNILFALRRETPETDNYIS